MLIIWHNDSYQKTMSHLQWLSNPKYIFLHIKASQKFDSKIRHQNKHLINKHLKNKPLKNMNLKNKHLKNKNLKNKHHKDKHLKNKHHKNKHLKNKHPK